MKLSLCFPKWSASTKRQMAWMAGRSADSSVLKPKTKVSLAVVSKNLARSHTRISWLMTESVSLHPVLILKRVAAKAREMMRSVAVKRDASTQYPPLEGKRVAKRIDPTSILGDRSRRR